MVADCRVSVSHRKRFVINRYEQTLLGVGTDRFRMWDGQCVAGEFDRLFLGHADAFHFSMQFISVTKCIFVVVDTKLEDIVR